MTQDASTSTKTVTLKMTYQDSGPSEELGIEGYYILIQHKNKLEPILMPDSLKNHFPEWSIWEITEDCVDTSMPALINPKNLKEA